MIVINPQFRGCQNGVDADKLLSLCRNPEPMRIEMDKVWDPAKFKAMSHYIDEAGDLVIETLSNDKRAMREYILKLQEDGVVDKHGCAIGFDKQKRKIALIRRVIENDELSADAMVSEIGEIIGEGD